MFLRLNHTQVSRRHDIMHNEARLYTRYKQIMEVSSVSMVYTRQTGFTNTSYDTQDYIYKISSPPRDESTQTLLTKDIA